MSNENTKPSSHNLGMSPEDWAALRERSDADIVAAAESDPDNPPLTEAQLTRMRPISRARYVRRKLGLDASQFAVAYGIPLDTLRAWERHEVEPTAAELSYLDAILRAPDAVRRPAA
jgi:putative transcriptional regulator